MKLFGNFFKKEKIIEKPVSEKKHDKPDTPMDYNQQILWLQKKGWVNEDFVDGKRNVLLMDDSDDIISSVLDDLYELSDNMEHDFRIEDYNMITMSGKMAGFNVLRILKEAPDIEIDYALLDIILGGKKTIDGKKHMIDGIDVSIEILELFPAARILFFSGCIIEENSDPLHFKNRFENYTGDELNDYILPKDLGFDKGSVHLVTFFNRIR